MSDNYGLRAPSASSGASTESPGTVETAKHEAVDLKDTAAGQAKDVLGSAKDEASSVVGEAKSQAADLYAESKRELAEQAETQQQRIAAGLHAVSGELTSMASNSEQNGVASDLVRQVSTRLEGAASWLGDRDPNAVLAEVKRYARRKPGTFILGALIAGIAAGRLTRALAANASDEKASPKAPAAFDPELEPWDAPAPVSDLTVADTPIYAQSTAPAFAERSGLEGGDVRRDTF